MISRRARQLLLVLCLCITACSLAPAPSARHSPASSPAPAAPASSPASTPAASEPSPSPAPAPGSIEAFVPEAQAFVEAHRGLKFKKAVPVKLLEEKVFTERLLSKSKTDQAEIEKETKVLRALGLISGQLDLRQAEDALLGSSVVGYYDPKTAELVVRGAKVNAAVRLTLIHELTHALQDQYFNLDAVPVSDDDESGVTTKSVIEGDAVRIEREYYAGMSAADQAEVRREQSAGGGVPAAVPPVLVQILAFPYQVGPGFDQAVLQRLGQPGLDQAFVRFPSTSSQLLHPQKFFDGDGAHPVDAPAAGGALIDHGVLGEMGLLLILEPMQRAGTLSAAETRAATAGWGGDKYVAWDEGARTCVRTAFVMDSPLDTDGLLNALRKLAQSREGVTVEVSGPVTLTSCA